MDLTAFLQDLFKKTENIGPLEHKTAEFIAKRGSKDTASTAHVLGWKWLEQQADKNAQDPTRALAHGAQIAAAYFAAPYLLSAGGGGAIPNAATAGSAAQGLGNAGMFAADAGGLTAQQLQAQAMQEMIQQQMAQQALEQAATESAPSLTSAGMFSQVPGAGPTQTALLNAQTADFGGYGADMTAKAAMPAVKDAYAAGRMGTMDYAGNVLKADMAGMNDPATWMNRLTANLDKASGKRMALQAGTRMLTQQPQYQPQPMAPRQPVEAPRQIVNPQEQQQAMEDFRAGRITEDELRRRLGVYA